VRKAAVQRFAARPDSDAASTTLIAALAGVGSESADALIGRAADADPNVRASAADALGAIGGTAARRARPRPVPRKIRSCASRRCTRSTRWRSRCAPTSSPICSATRC